MPRDSEADHITPVSVQRKIAARYNSEYLEAAGHSPPADAGAGRGAPVCGRAERARARGLTRSGKANAIS
jgi:hypothetical protein